MKQEHGIKSEPEDVKPSVQQRGFRDIPLFSMGSSNAVTHLMKFATHTRVDPNNESQFTPPVKLNRKLPLRVKMPPAKPGDQVIDKWGKPVMDKEGHALKWPSHDVDLETIRPYLDIDKPAAQENDASTGSGTSFTRNRMFKKRVREVHKSSSSARRTRNEEYYPWVLEDFETPQEWESSREPLPNSLKALEAWYFAEKERRESRRELPAPEIKQEANSSSSTMAPHAPWVGQLEGDSDERSTSHHVLFAFDDRNAGGFKVVPVRRQYKFMQLHKRVLTSEQVEEEFERHQRSSETERWFMRDRYNTGAGLGAPGGSSSGQARGRMPALALPGQPSLGWQSSSRLVAVSGEPQRRADDDDDLFGTVRKNETTYDELDFEDSFEDDDERADGQDDDDADAKELDERLKREMVADRLDDAHVKREPDELDDAVAVNRRSGADNLLGSSEYGRHDDAMLTGSGRQMRKIMKALSRREGLDTYDSDEEAKNPYASEESDESDEELTVLHPERALLAAREQKARLEKTKESSAASTPPTRSETPELESGVKRKNETARLDDAKKKARTESWSTSPVRSGSPSARSLSPLETEIVKLISSGRVASTSDLVQHFRARLKQDLSLKEQLSSAVKRIAYMDKKENKLKLKESVLADAGAISPRGSRP